MKDFLLLPAFANTNFSICFCIPGSDFKTMNQNAIACRALGGEVFKMT
jgi:hypothetical protein